MLNDKIFVKALVQLVDNNASLKDIATAINSYRDFIDIDDNSLADDVLEYSDFYKAYIVIKKALELEHNLQNYLKIAEYMQKEIDEKTKDYHKEIDNRENLFTIFDDDFDDYSKNMSCDNTGFCSGPSCPQFFQCKG